MARSGEDDSGEETEGRWSQPVKIGAGANDNISLDDLSFSGINDEWIEIETDGGKESTVQLA